MGTCRFLITNLAEGATVKNGSGGSPTPPVRSEVTPFVMERALNADRRSLWRAGATNDTIGFTCYQLDIDLGSAKDVNFAAVLGLSCPAGAIVGAGVAYLDSYPSTYTQQGGMDFNGRDGHMVIPTFTKRYWALAIEATASPALGRFVLGSLIDLGVAPNPGSQSTPLQNRREQVGEDLSVTINEIGSPGHDFKLLFDPCTAAVRAMLDTVAAARGSVVYIDPEDRCFEVFVRGGRPETSSVNSSMSSVVLEMSRLP